MQRWVNNVLRRHSRNAWKYAVGCAVLWFLLARQDLWSSRASSGGQGGQGAVVSPGVAGSIDGDLGGRINNNINLDPHPQQQQQQQQQPQPQPHKRVHPRHGHHPKQDKQER